MDTNNINDAIEDVVYATIIKLGYESDTYLTLYQVSKLINNASGRKTPPQMMYNYSRQGLIKTTLVDGKKKVLASEAIAFATKYVRRNGK